MVIVGIILVYDCMASILFDPGSINSYIFVNFSLSLNLNCEILDAPFMFLPWLESLL